MPSPELGSVQSKRRDGKENSAPRRIVTAKERTPVNEKREGKL